jgi:hypothetical protein
MVAWSTRRSRTDAIAVSIAATIESAGLSASWNTDVIHSIGPL